ncbi:MAG: CPBP family intramembrane glutamic endopeptidase [Bryobacteraceae bacterium]|jgi:membrane protease YdiL (CAAX protease family)
MAKTFGGFRAALLAGWTVLGVAGLGFARAKGIPFAAALPVIAAFLAEYPFYLLAGFPAARQRLAGLYVVHPGRASSALPAILTGSLLLPYLLCSMGAIRLDSLALVRLAALGLAISLWYVILPAAMLPDAAFLALIGWVTLGHYFDGIYPRFFGQHLEILGAVGLLHVVALTLMLQRPIAETGFGFWPNQREWIIGVRHYFFFLLVGGPLALALGTARLAAIPAPLWIVIGTFFGSLWVSSLAEEFLFRGVLQQWMEDWTGNAHAALLLASIVFGLAHLWFRGFPNWRWVPVVTVLGWLCGRARNQAGSIRSSVVTHALVVTTWRAFFA